MRTLILTTMAVRFFVSLVPFAAFGTITTHAQVPGAALSTAEAKVIVVPAAPIAAEPKLTTETFRMLISCQTGYQGGLDDHDIARCVVVQMAKAAAQ
jgi:hypothetical protein